MKKLILKVIPWTIVVILILALLHNCSKTEKIAQAREAAIDEIVITKNKLGEQTASTRVMALSVKQLREDIITKDKAILELQVIAKKYKNSLKSATVVTIETNESNTSIPTVTSKDTIIKNNIVYIYPEYSDTIIKPWSEVSIIANKDSIKYNIKMLNKMQFIQRYHKFKLLAKDPITNKIKFYTAPELYIDVHTTNINTGVTELKSFYAESPKKYLGVKLLGIFIGGVITGIVVIK